jgi:hypothetical protein
VVTIHIVDVEIRDVAVIANLAGGRNVWAATQHERHVAGATEAPIARVDVIELARTSQYQLADTSRS